MKTLFGILGAGLALCATVFGLNYFGLMNYSFFGPKYQQVQTEIFKQSAAYNDGMQRDLELLMLEYLKSSDEDKAVMRPIIIHRFSVYDVNKLTPEQRAFLAQIKGE